MQALVKPGLPSCLIVPGLGQFSVLDTDANRGEVYHRFNSAVHHLPGGAPKLFASFSEALAQCRLAVITAECQRLCKLVKVTLGVVNEAGRLSVLVGTSVVASGFPIPSAPIVLVRLCPAPAVAWPPSPVPVSGAAA
jgi:hypothetical protein